MRGGKEAFKSISFDIEKVFTHCFKVTMTLMSENARPRRRTSASVRLPIVHLTWDRRESNFLTAGALLKGNIGLLVCIYLHI